MQVFCALTHLHVSLVFFTIHILRISAHCKIWCLPCKSNVNVYRRCVSGDCATTVFDLFANIRWRALNESKKHIAPKITPELYLSFFFLFTLHTRARTHVRSCLSFLSVSLSLCRSDGNTSFRDDGRFILDGGSRRIRISAGKKVFEVLTPRRVHCCRPEY